MQVISLGNIWGATGIIFRWLWLRVWIPSLTNKVMLDNLTSQSFGVICSKSAGYLFQRTSMRINELMYVYLAYAKKSIKFKKI